MVSCEVSPIAKNPATAPPAAAPTPASPLAKPPPNFLANPPNLPSESFASSPIFFTLLAAFSAPPPSRSFSDLSTLSTSFAPLTASEPISAISLPTFPMLLEASPPKSLNSLPKPSTLFSALPMPPVTDLTVSSILLSSLVISERSTPKSISTLIVLSAIDILLSSLFLYLGFYLLVDYIQCCICF